MLNFSVPLVIRGKVIEDQTEAFGGRRGGVSFTTPKVASYVDELKLRTPSDLGALYKLSFEEILDYLEELGDRLTIGNNAYLQEAFELSVQTSGLPEDILRHCYATMPEKFDRRLIREIVEHSVGVKYLEGWVESQLNQNGGVKVGIRAFGARAVHVIAGNVPTISASTVIRNAVTRGDAIIKTPSNDPLTGAAIARTMIDMAPDHPLTRHVSVAYWKGGDAAVEEKLYDPRAVEKIVAWGGQASIEHIARYIQPGIDLITLDPKLSSTIIGREAFDTEETVKDVATRIAWDVGALNQEACLSARVVYVESDTDDAGLERLTKLGEAVAREIGRLPAHLSSTPPSLDAELLEQVGALRLASDEHVVLGDGPNGTVIISLVSEPVDFSRLLTNRTVNLVPLDHLETAVQAVTSYTQTIGIYPPALKTALRDRLALHGAQRVVTLGNATNMANAGPHDGLEFMRRMCKWIIDEDYAATAHPEVIGVGVGAAYAEPTA